MRNKAKIGDYVKLEWLDTTHKDDLTLPEVKKLMPAKAISYGKLMVLGDDRVTIVATKFPDDDEGDEFRDVSSIPRAIVSKIIKLKEVK